MPALTGEPAYRQVADDLRRRIRDGTWTPGQQLPSAAEMIKMFSVSNTVIKAALNELRAEGLVVGQQGKGTFVRDPATRIDASTASPEYRELMDALEGIRENLRQVNERLALVEERLELESDD